jgi:ADP-heptose:LPS heptosyltransferase
MIVKSRALARPWVIGLALARIAADLSPARTRTRPTVPRRILIAHHLLLGDTLMVTPLLAKCRTRWPAADVVMTCPVRYAGLYSTAPYGVRVVPYDPADVTTLPPLLAERGFDLALVPGDNRLQWLARALDSRWIVAFAGDRPAWKDWPGDELRAYPEAPMAWGDLCALLVDGPAPAPYARSDWPQPPVPSFRRPPRPYVVLHIGASSILKQWPGRRWRSLGRRLHDAGFAVVLSAGPGEAALLDPIDPSGAWTRYAGTLTVPELWHLLAGAELLVCPDTGVAHLARVADVPAVVLYGPGSALLSGAGDFWRKSPYTALTIPDYPCRDQHVTMKREVAWLRRCERFPGAGAAECPEAGCMLALSEDIVWAAVRERLGLPAAGAD